GAGNLGGEKVDLSTRRGRAGPKLPAAQPGGRSPLTANPLMTAETTPSQTVAPNPAAATTQPAGTSLTIVTVPVNLAAATTGTSLVVSQTTATSASANKAMAGTQAPTAGAVDEVFATANDSPAPHRAATPTVQSDWLPSG